MPQISKVHKDRLLSNIVVAYKQGLEEFKADKLMPVLGVDKLSDLFGRFDIANFFRRPSKRGIRRAPNSPFLRADFTMADDSFKCEEFGLEHAMDDTIRRAADDVWGIDSVPVELLTYHVLREREIRVRDIVQDTTKLTKNVTLSGTSQLSDYTNSDPVGRIETAAESVWTNTGKLPNVFFTSRAVWKQLKHHTKLIDRLKYRAMKQFENGAIDPASFLDIFLGSFDPKAEVVITQGLNDTSAEGGTSALAELWGKHIIIAYVDPTPVKERPTLGYTMAAEEIGAFKYRDESVKSDVTRVGEICVEKLVEEKCGYLIKDAVA